jgi:phosphoadenosine phosphosulfate reductase
MAPVADLNIPALIEALTPMSAAQRIAHAYQEFGDGLILTTSFGPTAGVMLRLAATIVPSIRVITIRHGYESERTLHIAERFRRDLNLNLRVYQAPPTTVPEEGTPAFEEFKRRVKIEPFQRALAAEQPRAWLSGVMRDETEQRRSFDVAMQRDGLVVIYPILDWQETDAEEYCLAHGLPINRHYFDPTKGLNQKQECGLHLGKLGDSWTSSGL